ncbi:MAG TPA: BamA/TamA family outer membrane protein, partial [Steroidobacteraceae bacterium]|nr:BamA/TamA family outer membrane protein [Steroidobacteraceae bacterium]
AAEQNTAPPSTVAITPPAPEPKPSVFSPSYWFNPAIAPFLPVPEVATDPDSGTTVGLLAVKLNTDDNGDIRRIVAPDFLYNPYFGYGGHARIYDYPSSDVQWSAIAGAKERVERGVDLEYQSGILRDRTWSFTYSLVYDRDGTPRFFGVGNSSPAIAETDYTEQQEYAEAQIGYNLTHSWQLVYTALARSVDVLPGTLAGIDSLTTRFGRILGVGTNNEILNRFSIVYDTRDSVTIPSVGMKWVIYTGLASRRGVFNDSLYSEAGVDGRVYVPITARTVLAMHMDLRYLPDTHRLPFWALSALGGSESDIGQSQPLRGFGPGRFYDRDAFSASAEIRQQVASISAISTHVELELAPFVDLGRVFARPSIIPLSKLHTVGGLGIRGLARPFVVGYIDVGYGDEGVAVFTGIYYPF